MAEPTLRTKALWTRALPNQPGFWVMLSAAVLSAEQRAGFGGVALVVGAFVFGATVAGVEQGTRMRRAQNLRTLGIHATTSPSSRAQSRYLRLTQAVRRAHALRNRPPATWPRTLNPSEA
jgi:hypothetical protein